jgi:ABC-type polysaccharide/polyol phosphate export permease
MRDVVSKTDFDAAEAAEAAKAVVADDRSHLYEINPRVSWWGGPIALVRSLRTHRNLAVNFISRDLRLRYRDSMLGYLWSLLEPLLLSAVFYFLYVVLSGSTNKRAPLFIVLGVVTWQTFSKVLNNTVGCLSRNESLIKQTYFPRELFALVSAGSEFCFAMLNLLVAAPLMLYYKIVPTPYLLMVPLGVALACVIGLGWGLLLAPINVMARDIEQMMKFVTRVGLFLSPVMWTIETVPKGRLKILPYVIYNPMTLALQLVRDGVEGHRLPLRPFAVAMDVTVPLVVFWFGAMVFKRLEAEVIKKL